jgi:hypothetical protein
VCALLEADARQVPPRIDSSATASDSRRKMEGVLLHLRVWPVLVSTVAVSAVDECACLSYVQAKNVTLEQDVKETIIQKKPSYDF